MFNEKYRELLEGSEYDFLREHSRLGKNLMMLVVSGSKAHGTDIPTSDTDIRGVMSNSVNEIVKVERDFGTFIEKDTDTCIHTFDKTCDLMLSCNPSVMEMFGCRDEEIIYYDKHGKMLMDNYDKFLSIRAVSSFGGFANAQFNRMKHSLIANGQNPDTELEMLKHSLDNAMTAFNATHQGTAIDVQIRMVSDQELKRIHPEIKTASEYDKHHILVNGHFNEVDVTDFKTVISELHKIQSEYGKLNKENTKKTDVKLAKHMMDLVYIYLVGADLNSGKGMITYREKEHDMLMDIRNMKYLTSDGLKVKSDFYDLLNYVEKEYMYTTKNCVLPEEPDYEAISDMKRQVYLDILAR